MHRKFPPTTHVFLVHACVSERGGHGSSDEWYSTAAVKEKGRLDESGWLHDIPRVFLSIAKSELVCNSLEFWY